MTTALPPRIAGSLLTDTPIYWSVVINGVTTYVDLSAASFTLTATTQSDPTVLWTKTTGITGAVGNASTPSLTFAWTNLDMGALPGGAVYRLRLTCTIGGKPLIHDFTQAIEA
jgi:hypothetical protein